MSDWLMCLKRNCGLFWAREVMGHASVCARSCCFLHFSIHPHKKRKASPGRRYASSRFDDSETLPFQSSYKRGSILLSPHRFVLEKNLFRRSESIQSQTEFTTLKYLGRSLTIYMFKIPPLLSGRCMGSGGRGHLHVLRDFASSWSRAKCTFRLGKRNWVLAEFSLHKWVFRSAWL